jgi:hypothetical protein
MLSAGLPEDSYPLDPQELSDILRLATLPGPGQPWDFALEGKMDDIPTETLARALDLVGSVMDSRHLNTQRLRPLLLRRWPYGEKSPPREQVRLLKGASLLLTIGRDSSNLICYDSEESPDPTAAEVYGAAIPRLFTRGEVEQFLKVAPQFLDDLLRSSLCLTPPVVGHAHDMDEVLAIERTLSDVMTIDAVDRTLGFAGITSTLIDLKLLPTLRHSNGHTLVHPASVSALLHRLWLKALPSGTTVIDAVALRDACRLGIDEQRLGWVVAQAHNGSLPILRWGAPFDLASLWVERARLLQLVDWPSSELAKPLVKRDEGALDRFVEAWEEEQRRRKPAAASTDTRKHDER